MSSDLLKLVEEYGRYRVDGNYSYAEGNALWERVVLEVRRTCDERWRMLSVLKRVRPALETLIGEVKGEEATDWGLVNDCMLAVNDVVKAGEL